MAETATLNSSLEISVLALRNGRCANGAEELSIGGVQQELVAMRRGFPQQEPLSIRGPCQAVSVYCFWEPRSQYPSRPGLVDTHSITATCACQDGQVRTLGSQGIPSWGRRGEVKLGVVDLNSFGSRQVENRKFETECSTGKDFVIICTKLHKGLLSSACRRVPDRGTK